MDFEDILSQWDKKSFSQKKTDVKKKITPQKKKSMTSFLDLYPPVDGAGETPEVKATSRQKRRNYRRMKPQETLDLHGFSISSAEIELDDFLIRCKKRKIDKVLIIHGKGLHSPDGEAVLREFVRNKLKMATFIGEIGHPSEKDGGAGATWAIIKY